MKALPVTVVSGFFSAGKTTLLNHILSNRGDLKVAVIVNDPRTAGPASLAARKGVNDALVPMPRGCICCTLKEELLVQVAELASEQKYDYLLIEAAGIAEPEPIVEAFGKLQEAGVGVTPFAQLDTLVTVVDCRTFLDEYVKAEYLIERSLVLDPRDQRTVVDVLMAQIEYANVIVLNKTDKVPAEFVGTIEALLQKLNPEAEVIRAVQAAVPLEKLLNTRKFDAEALATASSWLHEAHDRPTPDVDKHGISSFIYRANRPFHPQRLMAFLQTPQQGLLRVKGLFWLCTRMAHAGLIALAGGACNLESAGYWLAALPEDEARANVEEWEAVQPLWDAEWGDRRQELLFIGYKMDEAAIRKALDAALLNDKEMQQSPAAWAVLDDPFGEWDTPGDKPRYDEE